MPNRYKVEITIVGMLQAMVAAALATQAVQPPLFVLPPLVALILVVFNVGLVFLAANMPSWGASPEVARAATAAEIPPRG